MQLKQLAILRFLAENPTLHSVEDVAKGCNLSHIEAQTFLRGLTGLALRVEKWTITGEGLNLLERIEVESNKITEGTDKVSNWP